jgi:hypothetical protein
MTAEQIRQLCEVDPEHFSTAYGSGVRFVRQSGPERRVSHLVNMPDGEILWWMLEQMPEAGLVPIFVRDLAPVLEGYQCGWASRSRGKGPTREDAVINAYIRFKRAQPSKEEDK